MIVIPGASSANNRMAAGLANVDPGIEVLQTSGLGMRAGVRVDSVDFVKVPTEDDTFFNDVLVRFHGRVTSLSCDHMPGAQGESAMFVFKEPEHIDSDDDVVESRAGDARPNIALNTDMPSVVLYDRLSREELYVLSAKGGHVKGYVDEATKAINDMLKGRTLVNIPVKASLFDASPYLRLVDVEKPYNTEFNRQNSGYDFVQMLPISKEMQMAPEKTAEDEEQRTASNEVERISRADLIKEALLNLEDEQQTEPEIPVEEPIETPEVESQREASAVMPDYVGPQMYSADGHVQDLDADMESVRRILADIRGETIDEPEPVKSEPEEPSVNPSVDLETEEPVNMFDTESIFGDEEPVALDTDDIFAKDDSGEDAQEEIFGEINLDLDAIDSTFAEEGISQDESDHRKAVDNQAKIAKMDMANDGAKSISDAQVNAPDPRFANEFDGFDL